MSDHCSDLEERYVPLRLLPGSRNELEINTAMVRRFLGITDGELTELTTFIKNRPWVAHVRTELEHVELLRQAERLRGYCGSYMLVNGPLNEALSARYEPGKWDAAWNGRAADADVLQLRSIFIDCDPIRPKGISSTDDEFFAARDVAQAINDCLAANFGVEALGRGTSGNGFFTLIALEPCAWTSETTAGISDFLGLLHKKFATAGVKIDTSVCNPARLMAAPGTMKRKGRDTGERPHRMTSFTCCPSVARVPLSEVIR